MTNERNSDETKDINQAAYWDVTQRNEVRMHNHALANPYIPPPQQSIRNR